MATGEIILNGDHLIYAGIGSRSISFEVMKTITSISEILSEMGVILRSGGANGCDLAFERGAKLKEIFLPWAGFNNNKSPYDSPSQKATEIAKQFHPNWGALSAPAKLLMARNSHQIFGIDFKKKSDFVLCWTPDGCEDGSKTSRETGGTGQALRIAFAYEIPIFNLKNKTALNRLEDFLKERSLNDLSSN